jgi:hypothetical protein
MFMIHLYTKSYFHVPRENKIRMADTCHFLQNTIITENFAFFGGVIVMRHLKTEIDSACVALASKFSKCAVF